MLESKKIITRKLIITVRKIYKSKFFYCKIKKGTSKLSYNMTIRNEFRKKGEEPETKYIPFWYKNIKIEECWESYYSKYFTYN